MNWRLGLHRISAVFWGFWGALALLFAVLGLFQGMDRSDAPLLLGLSLAGAIFCYAAHRLTCWIVNGFTNA